MHKTTFFKASLLALIFLLVEHTFAQKPEVEFERRYNGSLKGDMLLIGNNILSRHKTDAYNGTGTNNGSDNMVYVDIDSDADTFSSSSADLKITSKANCFKVVYAGL